MEADPSMTLAAAKDSGLAAHILWYIIIWYGMVWYGTVRYGMVWYGVV